MTYPSAETAGSKRDSVSDWIDPDDAPEWTDEMFDKADLMIGDTVIRRGRLKGSTSLEQADLSKGRFRA